MRASFEILRRSKSEDPLIIDRVNVCGYPAFYVQNVRSYDFGVRITYLKEKRLFFATIGALIVRIIEKF